MKAGSSSTPFFASSHLSQITFALLVTAGLTTGCGSSGSMPPRQPTGGLNGELSGNTSVTVLLSSTANDQVTRFALQFETLTLTSQSGKAVTLVSSQQASEFMHLNGGIEPLTTVTIPQDTYTSATVTLGATGFVCIAQVPGGGIGITGYSRFNQGTGATVSLPSPITVTGSSMGLLLDMQVSSSAVLPTCWTTPPFKGLAITPTFNLTPMVLSPSPTNSGNGKISGLKAMIASGGTTASSLTLLVAAGLYGTRTLSATSNNDTVFQGVSGMSALTPGMVLTLDGAIQSDGSLLAIRIEVEDPSAINEVSGPVMLVANVANVAPIVEVYGREELGPLLTFNGQSGTYFETPGFDFSTAHFQISGQFTNLQNLPFVPSFSSFNMVAGQNVDVTSPNFSLTGGGVHTPANTITLVPQAINGTVVGSQQSGSFTDYTVSLASYDLFPTLAVQQGQTTRLTTPNQVEVYIDTNTQQLNTEALAPGNTLRFFGLVFNDNGTLRMDCAQINDGVALSPVSSEAAGRSVVSLSLAKP